MDKTSHMVMKNSPKKAIKKPFLCVANIIEYKDSKYLNVTESKNG